MVQYSGQSADIVFIGHDETNSDAWIESGATMRSHNMAPHLLLLLEPAKVGGPPIPRVQGTLMGGEFELRPHDEEYREHNLTRALEYTLNRWSDAWQTLANE